MKLYHYKRLENLEHFTWLINYMNQKVWFTKLCDFNDPFEAHFIFQHASAEEVMGNEYLLKRYCEGCNLSSEELIQCLNSSEAKQKLGKREVSTELFKNHGAICLTEDADNIPMWAHYAKDHSGYCVIFEIDMDQIKEIIKKATGQEIDEEYIQNVKKGKEILAFQHSLEDDAKYIFTGVRYLKSGEKKPIVFEREFFSFSPDSFEAKEYLAKNSFAVKNGQWSYEKEYRLIVNKNGKESGLMDLRGYPFIKITGIILGEKIGKSLNEEAKNFILQEFLGGYSFKSDILDDRVKEYIYNMAKKYQIDLYLSRCCLQEEEYKMEHTRYTSLLQNESLVCA